MSALSREEFEAEARRLAGKEVTHRNGQSGTVVGVSYHSPLLLCSVRPHADNKECSEWGYMALPGGTTFARWSFYLNDITHVDGQPYTPPKPGQVVPVAAPPTGRATPAEPTINVQALVAASNRALTFLAGLQLQDQPRDVQQEQRAVVSALMYAIKPGSAVQ